MSQGPVRIDIRQIRPGLYISLGERWIDHDFLFNSFRVSTPAQIAKIRAMGITHIDYWPSRSTEQPLALPEDQTTQGETTQDETTQMPGAAPEGPNQGGGQATQTGPAEDASMAQGANQLIPAPSSRLDEPDRALPEPASHAHRAVTPISPDPSLPTAQDDAAERAARAVRVAARRVELARCERNYRRSVDAVRQLMGELFTAPREANQRAEALVGDIVTELLSSPHAVVNLMNDAVPDAASRHHVLNVTILSLLLGRVLELDAVALGRLGLGALLHDLGKVMLPQRLQRLDPEQRTRHEESAYRLHVDHGVDLCRNLGITDPEVLAIVHRHHERMDGSGFPDGLSGDAIGLSTRIVAIANRFDNLCHPFDTSRALTPAEALAAMYRREVQAFDSGLLQRFIRALGVWPPGTLVQLSNGAVGLVTAVLPEDTLRPTVMLGDPSVPRAEALMVDLREAPDVRIERALKPADLEPEVLAYLSPRSSHPWFVGRDEGR